MSKQYRVCSDSSPASYAKHQRCQFGMCFTWARRNIRFEKHDAEITMMMTFEENTEASQPFFLSYVIRCVRVEKLEDPAQCTDHIVCISHSVHCTYHTVHISILKLSNLSMMMSSVMSKAECKNSLNIFLKLYPEYLYLPMLTQ